MPPVNDLHNFLQPGHFVTGCNYWASHAGTRMWSDWDAGIVAADLQQLSQAGLQVQVKHAVEIYAESLKGR